MSDTQLQQNSFFDALLPYIRKVDGRYIEINIPAGMVWDMETLKLWFESDALVIWNQNRGVIVENYIKGTLKDASLAKYISDKWYFKNLPRGTHIMPDNEDMRYMFDVVQ